MSFFRNRPLDKTWFVLPYKLKKISIKDDTEIRFPEKFVRLFLKEFTKKGDRVLDPFAGFGTTLLVAQQMKRIGVGIEYDKKRHAFIKKQLRPPSAVIHGDARKMDEYDIPLCDFSLTSPPYMQKYHKENPLTNYTKSGDYKRYLADLRSVYEQVKRHMKKNAPIVLEIANIAGEGKPMTPLAWDIARELSSILFFEREFVYCHAKGGSLGGTGNHSYCLLFRNKTPR